MKKILLIAVLIAVNFTIFAQVGIGTTSPNTNAVLDLTSTTQGFLPPRMTQVQMNAIAAPAEGLMVYCSDCIPKGIYVNTGDGSIDDDDNGSTEFVNMITGESSGTDTTTEIVDLISTTTGRIWMDRNLGATQAATSIADVAAAGDLYQWGRSKDGHQSKSSGIITTRATSTTPGHGKFVASGDWTDIDKTGLWQDGLNDPCPTGYRVPTASEFSAETVDIFPSNSEGINGVFTSLKLPYTSYRSHDGSFSFSTDNDANNNTDIFYDNPPYRGGFYWTSNSGHNYNIQEGSIHYMSSNTYLTSGFAIRCIKEFVNESITDTETDVEELVGPTGRIWMDRNLGATREATSLTDAAAYGDLYQWGRAKDGHEERDSDTTTTTATSANAGHGNFIIAGTTTGNNWTDFAAEDALWPTGLNDPCPTGYRIPTGPELEAERNAFTSNDADGAFEALKLPLSGFRQIDGVLTSIGTAGYLWSSSASATGTKYLRFDYGNASVHNIGGNSRAAGIPIRCIKE